MLRSHGKRSHLLAQHEALTARELALALELPSVDALKPWIARLLDWNIIKSTGRTQATRYFVDATLLSGLDFLRATTLKRIEPHRLAALILEDVSRYPRTKMGEIHSRIGLEIPRSRIRRAVDQLVEEGKLISAGIRNGTRYRVPE